MSLDDTTIKITNNKYLQTNMHSSGNMSFDHSTSRSNNINNIKNSSSLLQNFDKPVKLKINNKISLASGGDDFIIKKGKINTAKRGEKRIKVKSAAIFRYGSGNNRQSSID